MYQGIIPDIPINEGICDFSMEQEEAMTAKPMSALDWARIRTGLREHFEDSSGVSDWDSELVEEYAASRVRAALEEAARLMENGELRYEANQIRALMPEAK